MTVSLEEVHLGLGRGEVTFDYWPDLAEWLADYSHLLFYKQGKPFGAIVILDRTPSPDGIVVAGYGLGFWLGVENDGPLIVDREYLARNNRLSNGDFELGELYWKKAEGSMWGVGSVVGDSHSGGFRAVLSGSPTKDDVLASTEEREAKAGDVFELLGWWKRAVATLGRLRGRLVFTGRFNSPDLLAGFDYDVDWLNQSEFPGDVAILDSDNIIMGPCTQPEYIQNGGFETGDFSDWVTVGPAESDVLVGTGPDPTHSGTYLAALVALADGDSGAIGASSGPGVAVGEAYRLAGYAKEIAGTAGEAKLTLILIKDNATSDFAYSSVLRGSNFNFAGAEGEWKLLTLDYPVSAASPQVISILPRAEAQFDTAGGEFQFDDLSLIRTKGNVAKITSPAFSLVPERTYKLSTPITGSWPDSGPAHNGTLHYYVLLRGEGRPDISVVSSELDVSQAATQMTLAMDVTPPSGYDLAKVTIVGIDLLGGNVAVGRTTIADGDTGTSVVDLVSPLHTSGTWATDGAVITAPEGTERAHFELVAEAGANTWRADDWDYHRSGTKATVADIIRDCLKDPDTGEYLVNPGTIHDAGYLTWDEHIRNRTNRQWLMEVSRQGQVDPPREWRHNAADNSFDWGLPEELFIERPITFVGEDLLLLGEPEVKLSVEDAVQVLRVIGATRQARHPGMPDVTVIGEATNDPGDAVDWNDNAVNRTRVVEDSTVDFQSFADARARFEADINAKSGQAVTVQTCEWSAWGPFDVGDWVQVYKPEALLEDRTNPQTDTRTGRRIFPKKVRVLKRTLTMARGDGYAVKARKLDGTIVDVSHFARWDDATKATLELGEQRVDFTNDPQGPAAGLQFLRFRASGIR